jgi:hypothetical protein
MDAFSNSAQLLFQFNIVFQLRADTISYDSIIIRFTASRRIGERRFEGSHFLFMLPHPYSHHHRKCARCLQEWRLLRL